MGQKPREWGPNEEMFPEVGAATCVRCCLEFELDED